MLRDFTFEIKKDGEWFVGVCVEVPEANGQGATLMACTRNLVQSIALVLDERELPSVTTATVPIILAGRTKQYEVELTASWEGVSVSCPSLPGCFSQGDDREEALHNICDAIKDYIEVSEERKLHSTHLPEVA